MVFCLTNDQTTNITKNPYIYWPHLVTKYNLLLNSTSLPSERISLSTNWLDNTRAYGHFLENNTLGGLHSTNGVSPFTFRYRDFCMSWNLNPDLCGNMHRHRWKDTKNFPNISIYKYAGDKFEWEIHSPFNFLMTAFYRPSSGTLDLQLTFERPLPEALTLMVMCSYESCIKLSGGMVELNYSL